LQGGGVMKKEEQIKLLDSLTKQQRDAIARLILATCVEGDWRQAEDGSIFMEDTEETLRGLASVFSSHDPEMAIN
jgi:hypothetical protein